MTLQNLEANLEANIRNHNCLHNTKRKFKCLHEAWFTLQELSRKEAVKPDTAVARQGLHPRGSATRATAWDCRPLTCPRGVVLDPWQGTKEESFEEP